MLHSVIACCVYVTEWSYIWDRTGVWAESAQGFWARKQKKASKLLGGSRATVYQSSSNFPVRVGIQTCVSHVLVQHSHHYPIGSGPFWETGGEESKRRIKGQEPPFWRASLWPPFRVLMTHFWVPKHRLGNTVLHNTDCWSFHLLFWVALLLEK